MTCVVGLVEDGKIWIGADGVSSRGNELFNIANPKVFESGSFLFGHAGSPRQMQILQACFNPPKQSDQQDIWQYLITDVMSHIQDIFLKHKSLRQFDTLTQEHDSEFLLGYKGGLYAMQRDFQLVQRIEGYDAVGCGAQYALGALHVLDHYDLKPKEKILKALAAATHFDPFVGGPIKIISQKLNFG